MEIEALHRLAMEAEPPPYDPRLRVAMSAEQYLAYRTNTGHTYYLYLNALVRILQPKKILELGTDIGRSAAFMMVALPADSTLITVEIGTQIRTDLMPFQGDPRLKIVQGNDRELSIYGDIDLGGIDFLYIDSDHTYEQVSAEWDIYRHFLAPGALVVMDDIHLNEGLERFWNSLLCPKVDAPRTVHFSGWGILAPSGYVGKP